MCYGQVTRDERRKFDQPIVDCDLVANLTEEFIVLSQKSWRISPTKHHKNGLLNIVKQQTLGANGKHEQLRNNICESAKNRECNNQNQCEYRQLYWAYEQQYRGGRCIRFKPAKQLGTLLLSHPSVIYCCIMLYIHITVYIYIYMIYDIFLIHVTYIHALFFGIHLPSPSHFLAGCWF